MNKKERKFFKKIEIFNEIFGIAKILKTDNGKEFDNQYIKNFCIEYDIKLIHSSLYQPPD